MPLCIEPKAEPIPGYRLIERLGGGGFGEVWRAEAPGGLPKAIKFVHGDTRKVDDDGSHRAEQELRAIQRVQSIRHPYLLSIERYDVVDGRLVIVTELADCNLHDRFDFHHSKGLPGIPRAELLRYLRETAEALDLLNQEYQLQHLDVKPQNIFLIHDHVKVADFGLVKNMEGLRTSISGGVTPVYAAPETFDSIITPSCDQYSLAIVYQELLTGNRPFSGTSVQQLVTQHRQASPNLASLPHADRQPIAKALSKKPESRHASCMAMVEALEAASAVARPSRTAARVSDERPDNRRGAPNIFESIRRLELKDSKPYRPETPPTIIRVRREDTAPLIVETPARSAPPEFTGNGVLFPAIVIGLGRAGMLALRRIRQLLVERFGGMSALPHVKLLLVDSDQRTTDEALQASIATLEPDEVFLTRLNRASHYLKPRRNGLSLIEGWFDSQWLYRIPRNPAVQGQRALGRLAFGDHYIPFVERIDQMIEMITGPDALLRADRNTTLGVRSNRPRVYVITDLGGGTGGGMYLDVAYAVRRRLRHFGYDAPDVTGLLFAPKIDRSLPSQTAVTANAYAALTELIHFCRPDTVYRCTFDDRDSAFVDACAPFSRMSVLPWETEARAGTNRDGPVQAAECVARELISHFGRTADQARKNMMKSEGISDEPSASTFGMVVLAWPRQAVMRCTSRQLCCLMIRRWTDRNSESVRTVVEKLIKLECESRRLHAEELADRLFAATIELLGQPPDDYFNDIAKRINPKGWFGGLDLQDCSALMSRFEECLGHPESGAAPTLGGLLGDALLATGEAIVKEWSKQLAQLAVTLIEKPDFRIAGADEAAKLLRERFQDSARRFGETAAEFGEKAFKAYPRLLGLLNAPSGRRGSAEFAELARLYPVWRFHSMLHRQVADVAQTLANDLSDQLGEIGFCRQRLEELLTTFEADTGSPSFNAYDLFPPECATADESIQKLLDGITEEDFRELDRRMQRMVQGQFTALVHVCLSTSNILAGLEPAMLKLAQHFLDGRMADSGAAELFFNRYADEFEVTDAIQQAFDDAAPPLGKTDDATSEVCTLSLPPGPAGQQFSEVAYRVLGDVTLSTTFGVDDIAFYREKLRLDLAKLPQIGTQALECFKLISERDHSPPHTRTDIEKWLGPSS